MVFVVAAKEGTKKGKGNEDEGDEDNGRHEKGKRERTGKRQREEVDSTFIATLDHSSLRTDREKWVALLQINNDTESGVLSRSVYLLM